MRTPTMHDVATTAGVSQATVSLVLNNTGGTRVSQETRDRVLAAVSEVGYRTNAAAKTLRDGTAGLVGFIGDVVASSPFAGRIVEGAQERAWQDGLLMMVVNTGGDRELERASIEALLSHQVVGIVYASMYHQRLELPDVLRTVPTVVLNSVDAEGGIRSVIPDEFGGGRAATEVLIGAGHSRIGMINIETLDSALPAAIGRHAGYVDALKSAGIAIDRRLVREGHGGSDDGYRLTAELMAIDKPPTALFCANDRTAWGAYNALRDLGMRVPDDVSIVGFDDVPLAAYFDPPLTSIRVPAYDLGLAAGHALLDRIAGREVPSRTLLPTELIVRASTGSPAMRA